MRTCTHLCVLLPLLTVLDDRAIRIQIVQIQEPACAFCASVCVCEYVRERGEREREREDRPIYITERGGDVTITVTILAYRGVIGER